MTPEYNMHGEEARHAYRGSDADNDMIAVVLLGGVAITSGDCDYL